MNAVPTRVVETLGKPVHLLANGLNLLQPLLALGVRVWVGLQFWKSGLLKLQSWDSTLYLFRDEYHVPVLPPELAAVVGTFGELFFPVLLFLGLFGRLGALGMSAVNIMAVVSYAHVLLSPGFEGAIAQHVLWGFMLVVLIVYGPGRISLDHLLFGRKGAAGPV
jgi:putative oxidoreductase